jgi:glycosyltransferase involved in cell wall biosynthesis
MPEVTVLLPVYDGEPYLREAIDSVLAQDFPDFELLVIDDASRDRSVAVVEEVRDARVRLLRNSHNRGLFSTLNEGISRVDSPLVRLWAQDDRMCPGGLGRFVEFARHHPSVGMVYSRFFSIDAYGKRTRGEHAHASQYARTPDVAGATLSALLFWCYGCLPGNISTVLLRRAAWESCGGFFEDGQQTPDFEMWVRLSERWEVGFLREPLVEVRDHPRQLGQQGRETLATIEEELTVIRLLEARLRGLVSDDVLRRGWRTRRGLQHVHWVVRALARGDFSTAWHGWRGIRRYGQPWAQLASWLASGNGRWFLPDRDALFDREAARAGLVSA